MMRPDTNRPARVYPAYMAHFVIRTVRYEESLAWYRTFFLAQDVYTHDGLTFLTFDDEHHRVAIGRVPGLEDHREDIAGIDHIAFSMRNLGDLILTYERLKSDGILPFWAINHGPTTSLYFKDPDGVKIELQSDNTAGPGGARGFFETEEFANNPVGVEFDPDLLAARYHAGAPVDGLMRRGSAPVT